MLETKHHWLPVILAVFLPVTFVITYAIAVGNDHVEPGFPYISDTGTFPPESCVFGQLLNIGAVISGIIVYIRYRHIYLLFENVPDKKSVLNINVAAFWIGMMTNLGVSVVGNFQESNVLIVHLIGAFMAFVIGFVYCVLQTVISFKTAGTSKMMGNTPRIRKIRVVLCVLDAIFIAIEFPDGFFLPDGSRVIVFWIQATILVVRSGGRGLGNLFTAVVNHVVRRRRRGGDMIRHTMNKFPSPLPPDLTITSSFAGSKGPGEGIKSYKWTSSDPGYTEHLIATISEWLAAIAVVIYFATFYPEFKHFRVTPPHIVHYQDQDHPEEQLNQRISSIAEKIT